MNDQISRSIWRAWRTLGVPVALEPIDEATEGVIDPEALIIITLLFEEDPRILVNVAAWLEENEDLLIANKLSVFKKRTAELTRSQASKFGHVPPKLRKAMQLSQGAKTTSLARKQKLAPRPAMANSSRVVFNRLFHGVSARADIITSHEVDRFNPPGSELAKLLGVDASTVSRVRQDLRDCGVLRPRGFKQSVRALPGYFVSGMTVSNLMALADASRVKDAELRRSMLPDIDERLDRLSHDVVAR